MRDIITPDMISGWVRGWLGDEPVTDWQKNLVMYDWATIVGRLIRGNLDYRVAGMYLEFENNAGTATVPAFDRGDGISYYQGLSGSAVRDFLRVPLLVTDLTSDNETNFPGGNRLTFFAQSQGSTGIHGRTFSNAANSKVFGAALVAMPEQADYTQDLVFSRFYFDTSDQIAKSASSNVGIEWAVPLQ